jgi:hypothetical protein
MRRGYPKMEPEPKPKNFFRYVIVIFLLLSIGIGTGGFFYYSREKQRIKKTLQDELIAIADLKVKQVVNWRHERFGDATQIFNNHCWSTPI